MPLAPEERLASQHIPGGMAAITPRAEGFRAGEASHAEASHPGPAAPRKRKRQRQAGGPPPQTPPGGVKGAQGSGGKSSGKGGKNDEKCRNYNEGNDTECGRMPPNSKCPHGRLHVCWKCGSPGHRTKDCQ